MPVLFKIAQKYNLKTTELFTILKSHGFDLVNKPNQKLSIEHLKFLEKTFESVESNGHIKKEESVHQALDIKPKDSIAESINLLVVPDDFKNDVKEIANSILYHRMEEDKNYMPNKAISRLFLTNNDAEGIYWVVLKENLGATKQITNLTGGIDLKISKPTTLTSDGKVIFRDSIFGKHIIYNDFGSFDYIDNAKKSRSINIINRALYDPFSKENDAINLEVRISKNNILKSRLLSQLLNEINLKTNELEQIKEDESHVDNTDIEIEQLLLQRNKAEDELKVLLSKKEAFIVEHAKLRHQPILDKYQENLKREHLLDGTMVIIDGGPGTGKTTSLIQRIKFSTDLDVIRENFKTIPDNLKKPSWIFFSPSNLLYLYLKESMAREGLQPSDDKVKVWSHYKPDLLKAYELTNVETKRPFLLDNRFKDLKFVDSSPTGFKNYRDSFHSFLIDSSLVQIELVKSLEISSFSWSKLGATIQGYLKTINITSISDLVRLFESLRSQFETESNRIVKDLNQNLDRAAARLQVYINNDTKRHDSLKILYESKYKNIEEGEDDEDEDEVGLENEIVVNRDFEDFVFRKAKSLLRKHSLNLMNDKVTLSKSDKELMAFFHEIESLSDTKMIGEMSYFNKYFKSLVRGFSSNLLNVIPTRYKKFRRDVLADKDSIYKDSPILIYLLKDGNKRLHVDEQSFLIGFINSLLNIAYKINKARYEKENHKYKVAFHDISRNVIGIDEATDFHIVDIYAMNSLKSMTFGSVSLCGDLMQRLLFDGIDNWHNLKVISTKIHVGSLLTSYRQSPTLLSIAASIYKASTGNDSKHIAYLPNDPNEPKALSLISTDPFEKVMWIANRIIEIHTAYGKTIPSIAIFHSDEDQIDNLASLLKDVDLLSDVGINIKACKDGDVLGENNTVRIFDIKHIKGLEFEAVFFFDIDTILEKGYSSDILLKNLYVGLSRATFYTAVTLQKAWPKNLQFLSSHFVENSNWAKF